MENNKWIMINGNKGNGGAQVAGECLSTLCQSGASLCTSDCSKQLILCVCFTCPPLPVHYAAIRQYLRRGDWYIIADAVSGNGIMGVYQSLESFFPGLQVIAGVLVCVCGGGGGGVCVCARVGVRVFVCGCVRVCGRACAVKPVCN